VEKANGSKRFGLIILEAFGKNLGVMPVAPPYLWCFAAHYLHSLTPSAIVCAYSCAIKQLNPCATPVLLLRSFHCQFEILQGLMHS
jgi:hypothetical protein